VSVNVECNVMVNSWIITKSSCTNFLALGGTSVTGLLAVFYTKFYSPHTYTQCGEKFICMQLANCLHQMCATAKMTTSEVKNTWKLPL